MTEVTVSEIGEFIRFKSCERRFKLGLNNRALAKSVPFSERLFNTLDPVLQEVGRATEEAWASSLLSNGLTEIVSPQVDDSPYISWEFLCDQLRTLMPGQQVFLREVEVSAPIGEFTISGRLDFVVVLWERGTPRIRIVEGKASRKDRTYHRIQLAAYVEIIRRLITQNPLFVCTTAITVDAIEGVVARIDEVTHEPQNILTSGALNLDTEIADLNRMLSDSGLLKTIEDRDLDSLEFQLNSKCDGCVFSVHCLPESARQRRLELTGIDPTTCRLLRNNGVLTIDELASLDLESDLADEIRQADGFSENLPILVKKASARRSTLLGHMQGDGYQVEALPNSGRGQLPVHSVGGSRLVRVYLQVDYDYAENRIGALAAHVTSSECELVTPFNDTTRRPEAGIEERLRTSGAGQTTTFGESRPVSGRDIVQFQTQPWTGVLEQDSGAERQILQSFIFDLIDGISEVAQDETAQIHFYVYSRSEMTQFMEACTRVGGNLLGHLRQLLGSRESLEQLIFSCLQDEINTRYAFGWTGRGLCVVSSLTWFGQRYHWTRRIGGVETQLDRVFEQDLFDFRSTLAIDTVGSWMSGDDNNNSRHRFEIRSRFHDTLTAPYWRALWRQLPNPNDGSVTDQRVRASIIRYNRCAERPGLIRGYLISRVHALRWLDERIVFKNDEIEKPHLNISDIQQYSLNINNTGRSAVDFLRLDHHVGMTDWITTNIQPLPARVQSGRTVPVLDVTQNSEGQIQAQIDAASFGLTAMDISLRSSLDEGSFVRLSPRADDPNSGQTISQLTRGGKTCRVVSVDWQAGTIILDGIFSRESTYVMSTYTDNDMGPIFDFASIDESPSDFVAGKVEDRIEHTNAAHVFEWFEPSTPNIPAMTPLTPNREERLRNTLSNWMVPHGTSQSPLTSDQLGAVITGLNTRVHLLKGPPGTGKTVTTAASVLARTIARLETGNIVLVAAHTHQAVNTIMERLLRYRSSFMQEVEIQGLQQKNIVLTRVHSGGEIDADGDIREFLSRPCVMKIRQFQSQGVVVIGGTTSAILKMAKELNTKLPYRDLPLGFEAEMLVVDEASMMVFPHFLSLSTLVKSNGEILLAGDNRQLAPIVAHDWEREDRPPTQYYQPFKSAYESVLRLIEEANLPVEAVTQSSLTFTFRLPPIVRGLIARLYRNLDAINLEGNPANTALFPTTTNVNDWSQVWSEEDGLILIVHNERGSRQSNELEGRIIEELLSAQDHLEENSVAVITPHRAQRALLRGLLLETHQDTVSMVDTVERLQGGEKPVVIVSGTESDPHAIGAAASFILNLNRANVAFSRTQRRLIVVCAATLLDHIPTELEDYESAFLWKSLRNLCRREILDTTVGEARVQVFAPLVG